VDPTGYGYIFSTPYGDAISKCYGKNYEQLYEDRISVLSEIENEMNIIFGDSYDGYDGYKDYQISNAANAFEKLSAQYEVINEYMIIKNSNSLEDEVRNAYIRLANLNSEEDLANLDLVLTGSLPAITPLSQFRTIGAIVGEADETCESIVYISKNSDDVVQYIGITNNYAQRAAVHLRLRGINIRPLMNSLSRSDARAVEQALIEIHKLQKNGGTLLNKINSIAQSNPIYAEQLIRGYELLESIGYME
jgi:hypothetical protein